MVLREGRENEQGRVRKAEREKGQIRREELTGASVESTSVGGWRSWQAGDTKELTALITMGHYGHSAVGHYINGPPLSTISSTGPSELLSSSNNAPVSHWRPADQTLLRISSLVDMFFIYFVAVGETCDVTTNYEIVHVEEKLLF